MPFCGSTVATQPPKYLVIRGLLLIFSSRLFQDNAENLIPDLQGMSTVLHSINLLPLCVLFPLLKPK